MATTTIPQGTVIARNNVDGVTIAERGFPRPEAARELFGNEGNSCWDESEI